MKIEVLPEQMDEIALQSLEDLLEVLRIDASDHPLDVAFREELIPALEIVIRAYGGSR